MDLNMIFVQQFCWRSSSRSAVGSRALDNPKPQGFSPYTSKSIHATLLTYTSSEKPFLYAQLMKHEYVNRDEKFILASGTPCKPLTDLHQP